MRNLLRMAYGALARRDRDAATALIDLIYGHLSPPPLPFHPAQDVPHPVGGVHTSPFGPDWQYWSRPFHQWGQTDRTAKSYMAFIRHLFETQ